MSFEEMFLPGYKISAPEYNPFEERILKILSVARRNLTTRQISFYSGISYNSAKHNLNALAKKGLVKKKELANRIYWSG
jgi:predicted transcriptional regulator